jgi:hypothetical protein
MSHTPTRSTWQWPDPVPGDPGHQQVIPAGTGMAGSTEQPNPSAVRKAAEKEPPKGHGREKAPA